MGMFGSIYLVPLFSQLIMGLTPTMAGVLLMPGGLAMGMMMPVGGRLADRFPPHYLVLFGFSLFALSSFLMVNADGNSALERVGPDQMFIKASILYPCQYLLFLFPLFRLST